ncbi:hypothetical protein C8R48DRAFT_676150 [Suillus tomentosus]|nr:hypothetical protein C8R48DRAFT_676150 [Suillus tomentosus]
MIILGSVDLGWGKQMLALRGNLKFQSFGSWFTHLRSARRAFQEHIPFQRRFSHFIVLHTSPTRRLPGIALSPLPEKQYAGRLSADFVEARRGEVKRYIGGIVRHPVARYAEVVTSFLGCDNDADWKRLMPQLLSMPAAGPSFFAHVFHPAFNVDVEDATEVIDRFSRHTLAKTSDGLQIVADLYDDHTKARRTQLATHDAFKSVAHPYQLYESNDEMAARSETVLNTTMAEMDTYHDQKVEKFSTIMREYLDGEIHLYKQVLHKLKAARRTFDALRFDELSRSPRQPSRYERDLEASKLNSPPLPQPVLMSMTQRL